jgi:hypothetical protein
MAVTESSAQSGTSTIGLLNPEVITEEEIASYVSSDGSTSIFVSTHTPEDLTVQQTTFKPVTSAEMIINTTPKIPSETLDSGSLLSSVPFIQSTTQPTTVFTTTTEIITNSPVSIDSTSHSANFDSFTTETSTPDSSVSLPVTVVQHTTSQPFDLTTPISNEFQTDGNSQNVPTAIVTETSTSGGMSSTDQTETIVIISSDNVSTDDLSSSGATGEHAGSASTESYIETSQNTNSPSSSLSFAEQTLFSTTFAPVSQENFDTY